ncbi:diguanylate cyclase domain-containing protein [Idiomarina xiamenensis]|uniref:Diguanylate cyclase n=1 Tax=Idiomarina xiamenensis 10-D-4 TaxID=740709 RepID=K2K6A2_9GAMM|nr:diguanylate cyclase [Idiomarina xiamenensis]EKE82117.1 diguanylate cyclase [Idiomarina xiamenensis 10-D-4]
MLRSLLSQHKSFSLLTVIMMFIGSTMVIEYVQKLSNDRAEQLQRSEAINLLSALRAEIEGEVNAVLHSARSLVTYIAVNPDSQAKDWRDLANEAFRSSRHVLSISIAPDNVISFVYPLLGNEELIGRSYQSAVNRWLPPEMSEQHYASIKVLGPMPLARGGLGLVAHTPIFTNHVIYAKRQWGQAVVIISLQSILASGSTMLNSDNFTIAIRGVDGLGADGDVFYGSEATFERAVASLNVSFPNGNWLLAATPKRSSLSWLEANSVRLAGYPMVVLLLGLLWAFLALYRETHGEARRDPLTGLANRRQLMDRLYRRHASGNSFTLLYIDLNSFKPINDRLGHHAGDNYLRAVAEVLRQTFIQADTVARTGGDEFVVLFASKNGARKNTTETNALCQQLTQAFADKTVILHGESFVIQASIGWANYPDDAADIDGLLNIADQRMYAQKRTNKEKAKQSI